MADPREPRRPEPSPAPGSTRSSLILGKRGSPVQQRLVRAIVLSALLLLGVLYWLVRDLGLDPDDLLNYAATSLMVVGIMVVLGVFGAGLLWLIRRLRR